MMMLYSNHIDFDEASKEWRKNKVYVGKGMFVYKCQYIHTNKKICNKPIHSCDKYKFSNHLDKFKYCKKHLFVTKKIC